MLYKGPPINIKSTDNLDAILETRQAHKLYILDLSIPEERKQYEDALTQVTSKEATISKEDIRYDERTGCWKVFLRLHYMWRQPRPGAEMNNIIQTVPVTTPPASVVTPVPQEVTRPTTAVVVPAYGMDRQESDDDSAIAFVESQRTTIEEQPVSARPEGLSALTGDK